MYKICLIGISKIEIKKGMILRMENNENDVQNQVNEVKTEVKKEKKKSSGSGVKGLVIAVLLILFLGIGLGGGVLLSTGKWNPFVKNSTETKTEYAKFLETINEENFRTIQMDKLKDNYDYDSYKIQIIMWQKA